MLNNNIIVLFKIHFFVSLLSLSLIAIETDLKIDRDIFSRLDNSNDIEDRVELEDLSSKYDIVVTEKEEANTQVSVASLAPPLPTPIIRIKFNDGRITIPIIFNKDTKELVATLPESLIQNGIIFTIPSSQRNINLSQLNADQLTELNTVGSSTIQYDIYVENGYVKVNSNLSNNLLQNIYFNVQNVINTLVADNFILSISRFVDIFPDRISGSIWADLDEDGIFNNNDIGLSDITINLREPGSDGIIGNNDDSTVSTTHSSTSGAYSFVVEDSGSFYVEVIRIGDVPIALQNIGTDDSVDSDITTTTGRSEVVSAGSFQSVYNLSAGLLLNKISPKTGLTYFQKYIYGIDFDDANPHAKLPKFLVSEDKPMVRYRRRKNSAEIKYNIQTTEDLKNYIPASKDIDFTETVIDNGDGTETVEVKFNFKTMERDRFFITTSGEMISP